MEHKPYKIHSISDPQLFIYCVRVDYPSTCIYGSPPNGHYNAYSATLDKPTDQWSIKSESAWSEAIELMKGAN